MHQSFTDTLVKWFFDNFTMFADSFSVLSVHCVARGLDASFLYWCPTPPDGSLRQYGLLVVYNTVGRFSCFSMTVCKTVRPMQSVRCLSCPVLSVCL